MVDLFSSLDKQPMIIQVAIIDVLEDVVHQWLCKHSLSRYVLVLIFFLLHELFLKNIYVFIFF